MFFFYFYLVWLLIFAIIRIYLLISASEISGLSLQLIVKTFYIGARLDITVCSYLLAPIILILPLLEKKFLKEIYCKKILYAYFSVIGFIIFYFTIIEIFYFKEYGQRYNHLAVEYLKYPREVFSNIYQYYPIIKISIAIFIAYFFLAKILKKIVYSTIFFALKFYKRILLYFLFLMLIFIGCRNSFDHRPINIGLSYFSKYQILNEISLNGFFSFSYAVIDKLKNEIDYEKNYFSLNDIAPEKIIRQILSAEKNINFLNDNSILRIVNSDTASKKYNVVIIIEESFGAEFTGILGSEKYKKLGITPNIDKLSDNSIFFTNAYSTGTRTARGIEALISSFPPIPGESVIKRSKTVNNFFTIAKVLKNQGYTTHFIYGGQAIFDNMRGFFNSNGFDNIIEEKDFKKPVFKSVWGVSDEDLFNKADEIFQKQNQPFLAVLLTTSNHMPFTFPDGRIQKLKINIEDADRLNAIKYADFAIGNYLDQAKKSKYFDNTIFVIVADHSARVFGGNIIPIDKFHIPLLFFAPKILKPQKINTIVSQIDVAPTILGILGISYKSIFLGRNVFNLKTNEALTFALLQYDKLLGLLDDKNLTILYPNKTFKIFKNNYSKNQNDYQSKLLIPKKISTEKLCTAYFQYADFLYKNSEYKINE